VKALLPLLGRDPHRPERLELVGRYALGVTWQDGHQSLFPFAALRAACACPACAPAAPAAPAWPAAIHREPAGLRVRWSDGHETHLEGRELRPRCPCAACAGRP
jgi:DUF971 family protein